MNPNIKQILFCAIILFTLLTIYLNFERKAFSQVLKYEIYQKHEGMSYNSYDQRLNMLKHAWRKTNNDLTPFKCDDIKKTKSVHIDAVVLNSYRKIDKNNYIYKTAPFYNVKIINTTKAVKTNNWERNCQQAHTQVLDSFFSNPDNNYILILEDDLLEEENITENEFKEMIYCAINSRVHFLSFMHNGMNKYGYGTQIYLISRLSYFDFFRKSCFAINSPIPIDLCLSDRFNLLVTYKNFVKHAFNTNNTTRNSFNLTHLPKDNGLRIEWAQFDDPIFIKELT